MSGKASGKENDSRSGAEEIQFLRRRKEDFGFETAYLESLEDEFGPCLIGNGHPVLAEYLDWWEGQQNKILKEVSAYPERKAQVEEELSRIRDVRRLMEVMV